jgi:hypothetical protein
MALIANYNTVIDRWLNNGCHRKPWFLNCQNNMSLFVWILSLVEMGEGNSW